MSGPESFSRLHAMVLAGLAGTLLFYGFRTPSAADEEPFKPKPPIKLQPKKSRKTQAPDKKTDHDTKPPGEQTKPNTKTTPDEKKRSGPEAPAAKRGEAPEETLKRIAQNMRRSEKRLEQKLVDEGTRQVQRDILKDLDDLIAQKRQQQQQQRQQAGSRGGQSGNDQSSRRSTSTGDQQKGTKHAPGQRSSQATTRSNGNNGGDGRGNKADQNSNKLADVYKDIWGHLPEKMRQEMDAYSREQFMMKYRDLLKQYYKTLAEKGRRSRR
ncbi:MAG: hypothetical protein KatS3mg105_0514 [Gemmatales bacterium]|nr:MAG: hypothetical protein KatS3mg105_0514 [Gemmatales bacterium]